MAIQMRRGNNANLDKSRLVAGEFAVSLDQKKVCVSQGNGETIDLATQDDLQNIITYEGAVSVIGKTLTFSPKE